MFTARSICRLVSFQQIRQLNVTRGMASSKKNDLEVNHSLDRQEFYIELGESSDVQAGATQARVGVCGLSVLGHW